MGCTISTKYRKKIDSNFISNINQIKVEPSLFIIENKKKFQEVYRIAQSLGNGTYGDVKTCYHKETGQKRAVKLFRKDLMRTEQDHIALVKEFNILKSLDH